MKNLSRKAFFERYGFKMTNPYWAWSGVNEEKKQVMFNVWAHYKEKHNGKPRYIALCDEWQDVLDTNVGFNDSLKNLKLVMNEGYELCIAIAEPTVEFSMPCSKPEEEVKIKRIRPGFYFICDVEKEGSIYWATPTERVNVR